MRDPKTYHFRLPRYQGAPLPEPPHSWYPGVRQHHSASTSERSLRGDGTVRAFVIHATAGKSSASAMSVMFAHRASWHWLIPDENEAQHGKLVWACAPEGRAAWHVRNDRSHPDVNAGARYINYWSLGVEIVNNQQRDPFSGWQVEQAAALVRYAWSKYPELVDVVSHAKLDPARRSDPGAEFPWERFRELVLAPLAPPAVVSEAALTAAAAPIVVIGPSGQRIDCDARLLDGVTVVEARPLIEALGYRVEYEDGPPMVMNVRARKTARSPTRARPTARRST
jgi:N-acetyl-anhydromuramyl-L-alanine amidase AmpD